MNETQAIVGAHNALAARLIQEAGFDGCWVSSLEICASKGIPDRNLIGSREMLDVAQTIREATSLPIFVDCDNGYGTDLGAVRAARQLAGVGVTGLCIEDNAFPKRNSLLTGLERSLEPADSFAGRIHAIREAVDPGFVIIARTEAVIAGQSVEEAFERALAYADAGADEIVIHWNRADSDAYLDIARRWPGPTPLVAIPTACPNLGLKELSAAGYRRVIFANQLLRAAILQMRHMAAALRNNTPPALLDNDMSMVQEILRLSGEFGWPTVDADID